MFKADPIAATLFVSRVTFLVAVVAMALQEPIVLFGSVLIMIGCFAMIYFGRCPECGGPSKKLILLAPKSLRQFLSPTWKGYRCGGDGLR